MYVKNLQRASLHEPFRWLELNLRNIRPGLTSSVTPVRRSLLTHRAGKLLTSGAKVKNSCQQVRMWDDMEKERWEGGGTLYFSQGCQLLTVIIFWQVNLSLLCSSNAECWVSVIVSFGHNNTLVVWEQHWHHIAESKCWDIHTDLNNCEIWSLVVLLSFIALLLVLGW